MSPLPDGEGFGGGIFGLDHRERGAGKRSDVADGQVYLVGRGGVEFEVTEAPPPWRGEAGGLTSGRDRLLQPGHPRVDLPSLHVRSLGTPGVAGVEGVRHLFEHGCRLLEDQVRGVLDHALWVDRE